MMLRQILALLVVAIAAPAFAGDYNMPRISVWGTAKRQVAPDLMEWTLEVRTEGLEVAKVASRHRESVANLLDYLSEQPIDHDHTRTARMQLQEQWEYRDGRRFRNGFFALTQVTFRSRQFEAYDSLWKDLTALPGVEVNNVALTIEDRIPVQNEVRIEALQAARSKAEAMAGALDARIAEPLLIEEQQQGSSFQPRMMNQMMAMDTAESSGGSSISLGLIPVEVQVHVVFRLLSE